MIPKSGSRFREDHAQTWTSVHGRIWQGRISPEMTFTLDPRAVSAGYRLAAFDHVGSTNAEAMVRAREGERGPMWFVTSEQTAGRGRRHRPWVAPRGNLASSILEVIDVSPAVAATLGFAAGLALEAALQRVSIEASLRSAGSDHMKYQLKWPNDVLAGAEARRHPAGSRP
jgi:BirA family biotin operon repressor/biotin-[acetyl-CoA-carboxylase] ligase